MPIALITGATAGIGEATAHTLAAAGYDLVLIARRKERLSALQKSIEKETKRKILTLSLDVRDRKKVEKSLGALPDEFSAIDVLVNNAGLALGREPIYEGNTDDWETILDTNVKGLLFVTRAVLPGMIKRKKGHVINIGSIAGKEAYKGGNVYNASKFAVDALSKGMRIDLLPYSIRVTAIHPGKVETEFSVVRFKGDQKRAREEYEGFTPLKPQDIADAILYSVSRPPHVNINEMIVMPTAQADTVNLYKG